MLGLRAKVWCWIQTHLQGCAALLTKGVYGAMQAVGVHLFREESTGPRTGGLPRSTCPRIGGPGVHQSGGVHCSSDTVTFVKANGCRHHPYIIESTDSLVN